MPDGHLRLRSRRADIIIIRGGENSYPAEVEAALSEHPTVRESALVGIPHEDFRQEVLAIVVTGPETTEAELACIVGCRVGEAARRLVYHPALCVARHRC